MNSEKQEKPSCYAILTAKVRYDTELSSTAKLLYAEITALSAKEGYCFASNAYFERLYNVSERSVRRMISLLRDKEYIRIENPNSKNRRIYVTDTDLTGTKMSATRTNISAYPDKNVRPYPDRNVPHNNIKYNNKFNNYNNNPQKGYDVFQDNIDHDALEKIVWEKLGK